MGGVILNSIPTYFLLSLLSLFFLGAPISVLGDDACTNVDCVHGKCFLDSSLILGYDCLCDSGWKKPQVGFLIIPSCVLPNCTVDYGVPPAPAPLLPSPPPPPFNLFNPCNLVWCGEGTCIANATGYNCQCNPGSANVMNVTVLPCFKESAFGLDCSGLKLGQPTTPPPPPPPPQNGMSVLSPPPPGSPPNGSNKMSRSWRSCYGFNIVLLSAIIFALVI